jgi:hypothetical protein
LLLHGSGFSKKGQCPQAPVPVAPAVTGRNGLPGQPQSVAASLVVGLNHMKAKDGKLFFHVLRLDRLHVQHQAGTGLAGKGLGVQPRPRE